MELLGLALAPGLALSLFFYLRDKYEKEPVNILVKAFLLGAAMVVPAALLELGLAGLGLSEDTGNLLITFLYAVLGIALIEEGAKYLVIRHYAYQKQSFNEPYDGIIYAVMVALGFATLENIFYVIQGGFGVGVIRAFLSVPGHALYGVLIGYYLGLAKFTKLMGLERRYQVTGLSLAVTAHGLYDFFLFSEVIFLILLIFPLLIVCWVFTFRAIRLHHAASPFIVEEADEEVPIITTPIACPSCGNVLVSGSRLCTKCGAVLT